MRAAVIHVNVASRTSVSRWCTEGMCQRQGVHLYWHYNESLAPSPSASPAPLSSFIVFKGMRLIMDVSLPRPGDSHSSFLGKSRKSIRLRHTFDPLPALFESYLHGIKLKAAAAASTSVRVHIWQMYYLTHSCKGLWQCSGAVSLSRRSLATWALI